jgi:hypothetical protein
MWRDRFHYTEEEFMLIQDARFEQKPFFDIGDIIDDPFAGGISAFGAITDNYHFPGLRGVDTDPTRKFINTDTLVINSLGVVEHWRLTFACAESIEKTSRLLASPKERFIGRTGRDLETAITAMLDDPAARRRLRIFFNNEYYPALIPVREKMVVLHKSLEALIKRQALQEIDHEIFEIMQRCAPEWFYAT